MDPISPLVLEVLHLIDEHAGCTSVHLCAAISVPLGDRAMGQLIADLTEAEYVEGRRVELAAPTGAVLWLDLTLTATGRAAIT